VKEVQDSWYLVNCVDNNFLSGDLFQTILGITADAKTARKGA
jgi:hypothetical protein